MAIKKIEIRPKGDGTYGDVLFPKTSADMVTTSDGSNVQAKLNNMSTSADGIVQQIQSHINDVKNPHAVTKTQIGLDNVTNDKQATKLEFVGHKADYANPHNVTAEQTGSYHQGNKNIAKKDLSKYQTVKSGKDAEGMFTVIEYKTKETTPILVMKSTLSGGTAPQYTTRTEEWYASDGVTVEETISYSLSYDADGDLVSEV